MKIADKIRNLRIDNDMTQVELAKIAGVSDKAVSTWERGEKEPRIGSLNKLCAFFRIDIAQFINEDSDYYMESPRSGARSEAAPDEQLQDGDIIFRVNGGTRRVRLRQEDISFFEKILNAIDDEPDPRL